MVVSVFKAILQHVVINVAYRQSGSCPGYSHRFELEVGHRSGCVLGECLIYADSNFSSRNYFTRDKVLLNDLVADAFARH